VGAQRDLVGAQNRFAGAREVAGAQRDDPEWRKMRDVLILSSGT